MILDLDHEACLDPDRVGGKAAWLARARRAGLPVLPGLVVEARASLPHLRLGVDTLETRGPGGARLVVAGGELPFAEYLEERAGKLGESLVVRSSTRFDAGGEFSGAFTSYLELTPAETPKAVFGCWASTFTVATLGLLARSGVNPDAYGVSVLIQPCLTSESGGVATVSAAGVVTVVGVEGSPAGLLQGWSSGSVATARDGRIEGELPGLIGVDVVSSVVGVTRAAAELGANRCEWAFAEGRVWLLQLDQRQPPEPSAGAFYELAAFRHPEMPGLGRLVARAPGPLGEELVLPWAIAGMPDPDLAASANLEDARRLAREVTADVWRTSPDQAEDSARRCLRALRGPDPESAIVQIRRLRPPPQKSSARLLGMVAAIRQAVVDSGSAADQDAVWYMTVEQVESALAGNRRIGGARIGVGSWEPFLWSVVMACGTSQVGTPAAPGVGAGWRRDRDVSGDETVVSPRSVITTTHPVPGVAPLLWDSAGLVTRLGSPAAHLFESARSLGVPAVCGIELQDWPTDSLLAVNGHTGQVAALDGAP